jgi:hypothetical protein
MVEMTREADGAGSEPAYASSSPKSTPT